MKKPPASLLDRLPALGRLTVIASGALHTGVSVVYQVMYPDGISYLDIGDAYMRRDWRTAINPVWSPLYSWILGPVIASVPRSIHWEFPLVHLINFTIYLAALVAFEFFWRQLMCYARAGAAVETDAGDITLPRWAWQLLGYALFAWSSLIVIKVSSVTPDMLMAALVYVAAGLIVRLRLGYTAPRSFAALGVVLGLAYLAKSVMFPLALVSVAIGVSAVPGPLMVSRGTVALGMFLLVSGPFIILISEAKGRVTLGEAGRLAYVRFVNDVPYPHWQGSAESGQVLIHPSRKILDTPAIYEFGSPIRATYPISYDPSYWYEGVTPRFNFAAQLRVIRSNLFFYSNLFLRRQGVLVLIICILYWMARGRRLHVIDILRRWGLCFLALTALGLYALVLVEGRYVGVFLALLWADLLANVRLTNSVGMRRLAVGSSAIILAALLLPVRNMNVDSIAELSIFMRASPEARSSFVRSWPNEVAEELDRLRVRPGSKVAVIGYGFTSYWARLAHVQIVAEMFGWQADPFWKNDSTRAQAIRAFADIGAVAIVAEDVFTDAALTDWYQVGLSNCYIYLLNQ